MRSVCSRGASRNATQRESQQQKPIFGAVTLTEACFKAVIHCMRSCILQELCVSHT